MKLTRSFNLASLQQGLLSTPLRFLLIPFSWLYAIGIRVRNRLYALGVFGVQTLPCTVISVGNIAVGGTGKTPAVIAIAGHLQKAGLRVAILLRGYKREAHEGITVVSDGEQVYASAKESGDEAYMMAQCLSGVPIIVGRERYLAGQIALERFNVDVLLLDDAFQHRQLGRNVDILTVPVTHPFGNPARLLPAGTLREPPSALRRADIILLTHANTPELSMSAEAAVKRLAPDALILESVHQPTHLYPLRPEDSGEHQLGSQTGKFALQRLRPEDSGEHQLGSQTGKFALQRLRPEDSGERQDVEALEGKRLLAVCGIGNPEAFVGTLMRCSPTSVELLAFPDHHVYTGSDAQRIGAAFREMKADLIVTTQKDAQKLMSVVAHEELPIVVLIVALVIAGGDAKFTDLLLARIRKSQTTDRGP
ncbi:tetraacyldisaccharide 4'-kinase [Candidatus Poribacteria bacterium]|nr:MAG: tetraacyldisaccharide 4'-kinase [Candidatus Poribacteria bacterium]